MQSLQSVAASGSIPRLGLKHALHNRAVLLGPRASAIPGRLKLPGSSTNELSRVIARSSADAFGAGPTNGDEPSPNGREAPSGLRKLVLDFATTMRDKGFVASVKEAWVSMTGFSRAIWSFIAVIASWKAAQAALTFALACKAWIPVVIANPAGTAIYTIQTLLSKPLLTKFVVIMLLASPLWLLPAWIYFKVGTGRTISESLYQIFIILYGMEPVEDESSAARIVGGAVGILGTIVGGALLGVVINDVEGAADEVVKGNSAVIETGHTIVVGWTPDTIPFLRQVAIAQRENARPRPVVVLADTDKEAMDAELADLRAEFPAFKVLTREGRPTRRADLERVAAGTAERVVVMSGPGESDSLGRSVSAAAWGIQSMRPRGAPPVDVVVGLSDGDAANAGAEISDALGGGSRGVSVTCVSSGSDLGKVLAQAAVHPGLHSVLDSLLEQSFSSPEFYVASAGGLGGRGYGEVRRAWPKGAVVGIIKSGQGRSVMLNPRDDVAVHKDDKIIVVCQDLRQTPLDGVGALIRRAFNAAKGAVMRVGDHATTASSTRTLSNSAMHVAVLSDASGIAKAPTLVPSLSGWLPKGSSITVVQPGGAMPKLKDGVQGKALKAELTSGEALEAAARADSVVICIGGGEEDDADVVMLVGRLMDVVEKTGGKMPHVVAMVHDEGTGDTLAGMMEGAGMEASLDVVEPSSLSSAMLAQVASQPALKAVFEEILQAEGSEIFLVGPGDVGISTGITANFGALADRVRGKSLTAVGVVRPDGSSMLAPARDTPVRLENGDRLVVIGDLV